MGVESLRKVSRLLQKEEDIKYIEKLRQLISEYASKFKVAADLIESGQITSLEEIKTFFEIRIRGLLASDSEETDERLIAIRRLGLSEIETYIEMLYLLRQSFHQKYYTQLLDSLFKRTAKMG